jgi:hypothetical protein
MRMDDAAEVRPAAVHLEVKRQLGGRRAFSVHGSIGAHAHDVFGPQSALIPA